MGKAWKLHIVHVAAKEEAEKLVGLCRDLRGGFTNPNTEAWLGAIGIAAIPGDQTSPDTIA